MSALGLLLICLGAIFAVIGYAWYSTRREYRRPRGK